MSFRKLRADEIECRVAQVATTGSIALLLYKDARVDQNVLDETYGVFGWQKKYDRDTKGALFCTVSIKSPDGEWVSKSDTGTESNMEAQKGEASDAFKRACFNWGIGRELYTAPQIWVNKSDYTPGGKSTYDKFAVSDIAYDENGRICRLAIDNLKTKKTVFKWNSGQAEATPEADPEIEKIAKSTISDAKVNALIKKANADNVDINKICELYGVKALTKLNESQYSQIANSWTAEIIPKCKRED